MALRTLVLWSLFASAALAGPGGLFRFPDVSKTQVVFVYGDDLWLAPREGGVAQRLTSPLGAESFPQFSPDGTQVAFVGHYEGANDLYVLPVAGGTPQRVTHHPARERLCGWTPAGELLFASDQASPSGRIQRLFTVGAQGGLPQVLPPPYAAAGALSEDGRYLAYTPHSLDFASWKRYQGGMATDVWVFDLQQGAAERVTQWAGNDSAPMWHQGVLYYLSDAGDVPRLNLWSYDPKTKARTQLTRFDDYDVRFPSMGPGPEGQGEIVYQRGARIELLDLKTRATRALELTIPGDRPTVAVRAVDASEYVQSVSASPSGERLLFGARGDVWSLPASEGSPRNLTRTSGVAELEPVWSPDGRWIAYVSDASGEYALYVRSAHGHGEPRVVKPGAPGVCSGLRWSPDSTWILFSDQHGRLLLADAAGQLPVRTLDTDPWAEAPDAQWSPDSKWIVYARGNPEGILTSIYLTSIEGDGPRRVTGPQFACGSPCFGRTGELLYYTVALDFSSPLYDTFGSSFVYAEVERVAAIRLNDDVARLLQPRSDEEPDPDADEDEDAEDEDEDEDGDEEEPADPAGVTIAGGNLEARAVLLPLPTGDYENLRPGPDGKLLYLRSQPGQDAGNLYVFDPRADDPEEELVLGGVSWFEPLPDGSQVLVESQGGYGLVATEAGQSFEALELAGMTQRIDPRAEWRQIFQDAWRRHRDYFYVETMHGVDWEGVRARYAPLVEFAASRGDVSYLIKETIGELNVGHAYYWGGDEDAPFEDPVGLLGVDFARTRDGQGYRLQRLIQGAVWDLDARNPLAVAGVRVGEVLYRVNGVPVDASQDPWAAFLGLANQSVTLWVGPEGDPDAGREVVVRCLPDEGALRYRAWVEANRQQVEQLSGGKVGYVYVPDTGRFGQGELVRQFHGQLSKPALLIDDRFNGGGQIPTRFVELLNRPRTNYWARRDGRDWSTPFASHQGPKAMLINGLAGSGGDMFPYLFRQAGLGKLIGTRTWGGLVGITGVPGLIDGGYTAVPTFGFYETDGTWGIEGYGVAPDLEVVADPVLLGKGQDPQLAAGVTHLLAELERAPYVPPTRPAPPNRSGIGIAEEDR
ncbi:MAG: S41 family peptidase [Planctomycetota bacterium]